MELTKSKRGATKIAFNGYSYRLDKRHEGTISWRCDVKGCKGRLTTTTHYANGDIPTERGEHSHGPDPVNAKLSALRTRVLDAAANSHEPPRLLIQNVLSSATDEVAARVGSASSLVRAISRKRKEIGGHPPLPQAAADIIIPDELKVTFCGNNFVLHDNGLGNQDRILIFGTTESLQWLKANRHWLMDGTFKCAPSLFL